MKSVFGICLLIILHQSSIFSQAEPDGGGEYYFPTSECLSTAQRTAIIKELKPIHKEYAELFETYLKHQSTRQVSGLDWPVAQLGPEKDPGYYGISNFVDHNPVVSDNSSSLRDYNCGFRTYDVPGYNHRGTDIFTWPFPWLKMDTDNVAVIAAMEGMVIAVRDGEYDRNCAFCDDCNWNAVYVQNADGTVSWYGHLKEGSIPAYISTGYALDRGEFLGIIGSSGNSTGPHLHFELWDSPAYKETIDPYWGPCNTIPVSLWSRQKPYREPRINMITTGFTAPRPSNCAVPWEPNLEIFFNPGSIACFTAYLADQQAGDVIEFEIIDPHGGVFDSWSLARQQSYNASYWYWNKFFPADAIEGEYLYKVNYNGLLVTHSFTVGSVSALSAHMLPKPSVFYREGKLWLSYGNHTATNAYLGLYSLDGRKMAGQVCAGDCQMPVGLAGGLYLAVLEKQGEKIFTQLVPVIH